MADETYQPKVYRKQGGDEFVVSSGGAITVESGGKVGVGEVADKNTQGGIPVVHRIDITDGAGDTDVVLDHKTRVIDVTVVKTSANGGSGDTVTIKNGSNAITDAIDIGINDTLVARAGQIDDAQHEIAAGGTLKVTAANNTNNACIVYVFGLRVS
jgi:hypothetical protein